MQLFNYFVVSYDLLINYSKFLQKKAGGSLYNVYLYVNFRKFHLKKEKGQAPTPNAFAIPAQRHK